MINSRWFKEFDEEARYILYHATDPGRKRMLLLKLFKRTASRHKAHRMSLLKYMSELVIFMKNPSPLRRRREQFERVKHYRFHRNGKVRCFCCQYHMSEHRHHIILLSKGGQNSKLNITYLCAACHRELHPTIERNYLAIPKISSLVLT